MKTRLAIIPLLMIMAVLLTFGCVTPQDSTKTQGYYLDACIASSSACSYGCSYGLYGQIDGSTRDTKEYHACMDNCLIKQNQNPNNGFKLVQKTSETGATYLDCASQSDQPTMCPINIKLWFSNACS